MSQETFYNYKSYRWFWFSILFSVLATAIYTWDDPIGGRNGGTVLGYTYGILAALVIVYLTFFGVRKRAYRSTLGSLKGWLGAHIWLGLTLMWLVPLHSGFSFGVNVHTLAYVLMVAVILSGIWGAINYSVLTKEIKSHRGGGRADTILEEINSLSAEIEKVSIGGSDQFLSFCHQIDFSFKPGLKLLMFDGGIKPIDKRASAELVLKVPENEREKAIQVITLVDKKADFAVELIGEARVKASMRIWLYLHIPLTIALLVVLAIHILSVFYYW